MLDTYFNHLEVIRKRQEKWDRRFLNVAELVSSWSKDPRKKCGTVIVRPDRSIVSVGFNGFPRGVADRPEHLADREEKLGRVVHAEVNAILAAKETLTGCTMYIWPSGIGPSCDRCTTCIIQVGITRVVHFYENAPSSWNGAIERGLDMYRDAEVEVVSL